MQAYSFLTATPGLSTGSLTAEEPARQVVSMKWRNMIASVYLVLLCAVLYKQQRFLHKAWEKQGEERRNNSASGIHFARELEELAPQLDCQQPAVLYHRLPLQPEDFHLFMLSRFALSPCRVELQEREALLPGQRIVHRSHPAFPQQRSGLFARL